MVGPAALPFAEPIWEAPAVPDAACAAEFGTTLSLPALVCKLLLVRGIADVDQAKSHLRLELDSSPAGKLLLGAQDAVERILCGVRDGETILVHGDYDVDGICGAALLTRWLRRIGADAVPFVPHRIRDGYDFGSGGLTAATEAGATLVVTVDSGIRAIESVREASQRGIDVVVTDHHAPGPTLPSAVAIVNPNQEGCPYPNKGLCGTGVALRLCELLAEASGIEPSELHPDLDLVAMATIADVVPLNAENRTLVRFGLKALARTEKVGLRALLKHAGVEGSVDAGQVGFRIGPRINAVGRMEDAAAALTLLLTEDPVEADALAAHADELNGRRQAEERRTLDEVLLQVGESYDPQEDFGLVAMGEGWHPGVIGIVASRVVERLHRPTVVVSLGDCGARGSGRSISGFDLLSAIERCSEHLKRFGGHRQAAGMDLALGDAPAFKAAFAREAREELRGGVLGPRLKPDLEVHLSELSLEAARYVEYLGPFGMGNPRPVLLAKHLSLAKEPSVVGRGHLRVVLEQDGSSLPAIGFGLADRIDASRLEREDLEAVFQLRVSNFRGRESAELHLKDLRPCGGSK